MLREKSFGFLAAVVSIVAFLFLSAQTVQAGTTGTLTGIVTDATTRRSIPAARITAASASQIASVTADATGHFTFLALAPDTYLVSLQATGFEDGSVSGVTIVSDQTRTLMLFTQTTLRTIGRVTARSATSLVRPGTTADVYSVDATAQAKVAGIGNGVNLNNAYSAIATVPGAFVDPQSGQHGSNGIGADVYIRGGDYDQVGYEIDGVPVNRSFDNFPSGPAATLGQQELQVYAGSGPANAESQGLAGFVNQVIKVGSSPSFVGGSVGVGGPGFYHKAGFEAGGATTGRGFSYYVATDGYDQAFRYVDQFAGASLSGLYGPPLAPCSIGFKRAQVPSCFNAAGQNYANGTTLVGNYNDPNNPNSLGSGAYALGPYDAFTLAATKIRNTVLNLHFAIAHRDGTNDDIQFLAMSNYVSSQYANSTNDQGGISALENVGIGRPSYLDGYQYSGATGVPLPADYRQATSPYLFPGHLQSARAGIDGPIEADLRDGISNDQSILKLQFSKSLGTNALLKLYGYTYYSDWLQAGPQTAYAYYEGPAGPDYELSSHTRGLSGTFSSQLGSKHLLQLQGSYTTATTLRDNNEQMYSGGDYVAAPTVLAVLVDSKHPLSGICYSATPTGEGQLPARTPTTCSVDAGLAGFVTLHQAYAGAVAPAPAGNCGAGACEYLVVGNGEYGAYNTVRPKFTAASVTDQWRPNSRLSVDGGLRLDILQFEGGSTQQGPARRFWYDAFNLDNCLTAQNGLQDKIVDQGLKSPTAGCAPGTTAANFVNPPGVSTETYTEFQPRLAFTYELGPATVLRASYGRYTQPPLSAYQQYDTLASNAPYQLYTTYGFQRLGFTSPDHRVSPPTSNNYDFSFERSFGNAALKLSPFLRTTQGQIQNFYLDEKTGYTSGLNVGKQTSEGVEFELDKGNFGRDGLAVKLSLTYTHSYIRYTSLPNGSTIIDPLNTNIKQYNAYTSFCAAHRGNAACGTTVGGNAAAPCYTPSTTDAAGATVSGVAFARAAACTAADVANPYWNAPIQPLLDPSGNYDTYDTFPGAIGTSVGGYGAPFFGTLVVQYKRGRLAITPNLQFVAGQRYGAPASTVGVAPDECRATLASRTALDPRYGFGSPGGAPFDATTCGSLGGGIPDPYTGRFDDLGSFVAPSSIDFGTQVQYDISKHVSLVATFANLFADCFGGSKTGFTVAGACGYGVVGAGTGGDIGNAYNPGAAIQPQVNSPYQPFFGNFPFQVYVTAQLHI